MKYIRKVKHTFHAVKWTQIEKPKHEVTIKEESFKDLDKRPHYPISSMYIKGFSMNGGKSKRCRWA
jgi:hypothetical protein